MARLDLPDLKQVVGWAMEASWAVMATWAAVAWWAVDLQAMEEAMGWQVMGLGKDPTGLAGKETEASGEEISADRPGEVGLTRGTHL